jgi:hypothetical protein
MIEGKKITHWVQCERKNCKKWRKVPASIDMSTLPEKWYCEMNSWDTDRATCDGPEESDSDSEQKASSSHTTSRNQLIISNNKGPGTLSYRRMIFGTDGRIRPAFSERNKTGYGLFSYTETSRLTEGEEYTEPVRRVSYWFSGCYKGNNNNNNNNNNNPVITSVDGSHINQVDPAAKSVNELVLVRSSVLSVDKFLKEFESVESTSKSEPTYLLDAARRYYASVGHPTSANHQLAYPRNKACLMLPPRKYHKLHATLTNMPLTERLFFENKVVRSCLASMPNFTLPTGVSLTTLNDVITASHFHEMNMEACRLHITTSSLKLIVRRLEENGEVEILISSTGEVMLTAISPSLIEHVKSTVRTIAGANWIKKSGLPLKLRKMKI